MTILCNNKCDCRFSQDLGISAKICRSINISRAKLSGHTFECSVLSIYVLNKNNKQNKNKLKKINLQTTKKTKRCLKKTKK